MRHLAIATLLAAACSFDGGANTGRPNGGDGDPPIDESLPALDSAVRAAVAAGYPGAVVSIRVGDRRFSSAAGLADAAAVTDMRIDHAFRVASNSKSMIGAAFAILASEGAVELDGLAGPHLPAEVAQRVANADTATIRQLLNHTAGVPEFNDYSLWQEALADPDRGLSTAEALAHIYDEPADFAPGARFTYSNSNYLLAGLVLDSLAGEHHSATLRQRLFAAVPMDSAYYEEHEPATGTLARGYEDVTGGPDLEDVTDINIGMGLAAGAVVCTIADLADYVHALGGDLLDSRAAAEMFDPIPDDRGDEYGLGIGIESDPTTYGHTGSVPGFETMMMVVPGEDIAVAVGLNAYDDDLYNAAVQLFDRATEIARQQR